MLYVVEYLAALYKKHGHDDTWAKIIMFLAAAAAADAATTAAECISAPVVAVHSSSSCV